MIRLSLVWFVVLVLLTGCNCSSSESTVDPWDRADEIVKQIQEPVIPQAQFKLSDFGGAGEGKADNKEDLDSVIEASDAAFGGSIIV